MAETLTEVSQFTATIQMPTSGETISAADLRDKAIQRLTDRTRFNKNNLTWIPYEIENGIYSKRSMDVSSEDSIPVAVTLSADGTKFYMLGPTATASVYQYTLTTPYDVSTGSYASKSMDVSSEETLPEGLAISTDGSKMYVVGTNNDTVYQYTLGTPFDVSTGSYASKSMSVSTEDNNPRGVDISTDGTKIYISGNENDTVFQYTLSTAFDVATGSYASKSMSVSSETTATEDLEISADGTKMFVTGDDTVFQYTLSTAFDISTGTYDSISLSVSNQETITTGLTFHPDGNKMYIVGQSSDRVYEFYTAHAVLDL